LLSENDLLLQLGLSLFNGELASGEVHGTRVSVIAGVKLCFVG